MSLLPRNAHSSTRRPYWLLLVLALFIGGQVATSAHWHDALGQADADCALCVLSSVNGGAAVGKTVQLAVTLFCAVIACFFIPMVRRTVVRFHDSRAPPAILSSSV